MMVYEDSLFLLLSVIKINIKPIPSWNTRNWSKEIITKCFHNGPF